MDKKIKEAMKWKKIDLSNTPQGCIEFYDFYRDLPRVTDYEALKNDLKETLPGFKEWLENLLLSINIDITERGIYYSPQELDQKIEKLRKPICVLPEDWNEVYLECISGTYNMSNHTARNKSRTWFSNRRLHILSTQKGKMISLSDLERKTDETNYYSIYLEVVVLENKIFVTSFGGNTTTSDHNTAITGIYYR